MPRRAPGRLLVAALLVAPTACVYPATEPTGVELSWRFREHDESDGEDAVRLRTCVGAVTEQVAFEIADVDDPRRHGTFRFDCATGYQTAIELQTAASDAFVPLHPGAYDVTVLAVDDADDAVVAEPVATREIDVGDRGVTVEIWELRRAPVSWSLSVQGGAACDELSLALFYATPEADLADQAPPDDDAPLLYRERLESDRGLPVGGQATPCGSAIDGEHRFEAVDRGEYLLEVAVDGQACALRVDLRAGAGSSVIDLASLPCQG